MIDTHTHLYLPEFDEDRDQIIENAINAGVERLVMPNVDVDTIEPMLKLQSSYPEQIAVAIGLHPTSVDKNYLNNLQSIKQLLTKGEYCAIGEVGIDLYWDATFREEQKRAFSEQLHWAWEYNLPVIIHCREGLDDVLEVLENHSEELTTMIFHSFTGSTDDVTGIRKITDAYFGINGVVTFKNAQPLRDSLKEIGIERILLETDSPYLAPSPHRGKRNDSGKLSYIRDKVAEVLQLSAKEVDIITTENAKRVFKLK